MSVTIRLAKVGKKNAPSYKVVVANTRDKRTGRYVDVLGYYNPSTKPAEFKVNKDRIEYWKKQGALTTEAINKLMEGKYTYIKYNPKKSSTESKPENET
ncbi:MAG TPA: 30S ribosomal protein S16 [Patescibacteria group bacterium]|nr:30S ribosomal protein S16 [Patescibacteria group bacterium]